MFISNIIVLTILFIIVILFVSINSSTEGFVGYNQNHVEYKVFMNTNLNVILRNILIKRNNRINERVITHGGTHRRFCTNLFFDTFLIWTSEKLAFFSMC